MIPKKKSTDHWMVRMNRRNRSLCCLMLGVTIAAHLADKGYGPLAWTLLVLQFLLYPHLLYFRARNAESPRRAEMTNLHIDALCFGVWAAALGFPVWITFISLVTVTVNLTVFRGRKGFIQAILFMGAGSLLSVAAAGARFAPETDWPTTLFSIFTIGIYVLIVAENAYAHALKLHRTREQLLASEQALKQQLEEINSLQAQLREQANRDPLTGLYNRRFFDETLERELARCRREKHALSIVMIDIDHFKSINDTWGHQAGDMVLKRLATLLNEQIRASDVACRFGGEEFLLLMPTVPSDIARARADTWRAAFAASPVVFDGIDIDVTFSVGIATYLEHGSSRDELIRRADLALYRAKSEGRNRVMVADGVDLIY